MKATYTYLFNMLILICEMTSNLILIYYYITTYYKHLISLYNNTIL